MRSLACTLTAAALGAGLALHAAPAAAGAGERNPVFAYNGNEYIIRARPHGGTVRLQAYRAQGSAVWEPFGSASIPAAQFGRRGRNPGWNGGSIVARIYFSGRLIGYSGVDLDNPYNTLLYRAPEGGGVRVR
jgi:hypothetical protein